MAIFNLKKIIFISMVLGCFSCHNMRNDLKQSDISSIKQAKTIVRLKRSKVVGSFDSSGVLHIGIGGKSCSPSSSEQDLHFSDTDNPWEYLSIEDDKIKKRMTIPKSGKVRSFTIIPLKNIDFVGYNNIEKKMSFISLIDNKWIISSIPLLTEALARASFVIDNNSILFIFSDYIGNNSLFYSKLEPNNLWSNIATFDCVRLGMTGAYRFWKPLLINQKSEVSLFFLDENKNIYLLKNLSCQKKQKIHRISHNIYLPNITSCYDNKRELSWVAFFGYNNENYFLKIYGLNKDGILVNTTDLQIEGRPIGELSIEMINNKVHTFWSAMTDNIHESDVYTSSYDGYSWTHSKNISNTSNHSYLIDTFVEIDNVKVVWHEKSARHWRLNCINELRFTTVQ